MKQCNNLTMEKGISLYLALVILAVLLGISLGLSIISMAQIKIIRGIEESVIAFYAADTGIESMLASPTANRSESFPNEASYEAQIRCRPGFSPCPFGEDPDCTAMRFCIKSKGKFRQTQRAIEARY